MATAPSTLIVAALVSLFASIATSTIAQPAAEPTFDAIIVIGTRAKDRTVRLAPIPVDVSAREDLRRAGAIGSAPGQARHNDFKPALRDATVSFTDVRTRSAGSARIDSWLVAHNWQQAPDGKQYLQPIQRDHPVIQSALEAARQLHDGFVREAATRYGWH